MDRDVLTDAQWAKMEPHCLGKPTDPGRSGRNNRLFIWLRRQCCGSPARVVHGATYRSGSAIGARRFGGFATGVKRMCFNEYSTQCRNSRTWRQPRTPWSTPPSSRFIGTAKAQKGFIRAHSRSQVAWSLFRVMSVPLVVLAGADRRSERCRPRRRVFTSLFNRSITDWSNEASASGPWRKLKAIVGFRVIHQGRQLWNSRPELIGDLARSWTRPLACPVRTRSGLPPPPSGAALWEHRPEHCA